MYLADPILYTVTYTYENLDFIIHSKTVKEAMGNKIKEKALSLAKELLDELKSEIEEEEFVKLPFKMGAYWYLFRRYVYENRNKLKESIDKILEIAPEYAFLNTNTFFSKQFTKIINNAIYLMSFRTIGFEGGNQTDIGLMMAAMKTFEKGKVFSPLYPRLENKGFCECYTGENIDDYIFSDYPDIALVGEDEFWKDWEYFPLWDGAMDGPICRAHAYLFEIAQRTGYERVSDYGYRIEEWLD